MLIQKSFNHLGHTACSWLGKWGKAILHLALSVDEEFGEIPFYTAAMTRMLHQLTEQRMDLCATYMDLGEHGKSNAVVQGAEFFNLILRTRFLPAKVIAWKSTHHQPALVVTLMQFLQACVVRCESAPRGDVDNEKYLAGVFSEAQLVSVDITYRYFMQGLWHGLLVH